MGGQVGAALCAVLVAALGKPPGQLLGEPLCPWLGVPPSSSKLGPSLFVSFGRRLGAPTGMLLGAPLGPSLGPLLLGPLLGGRLGTPLGTLFGAPLGPWPGLVPISFLWSCRGLRRLARRVVLIFVS